MKRKWWLIALGVALTLAMLSPLASSSPDGLEKVAEDSGLLESAHEAIYNMIPDYVIPGINNEVLATILAGLVGTLILFGACYGLAYLLRKRYET